MKKRKTRSPRLYDKVLTPMCEQGFVHAVNADGEITIKMIDTSTTTTVRDAVQRTYSAEDAQELEVIMNVPEVDDLTPFGIIKSVEPVYEGIEVAMMRDGMQMIWLSNQRLVNLPDDYGEVTSHWAEIEDMDYLLEHYDLTYGALNKIVPKRIQRYVPFKNVLRVTQKNGADAEWEVELEPEGYMHILIPNGDGNPTILSTLSDLRATGIKDAILVSKYSIRNF